MITFTCSSCGQVRTAQRRRCYPCTVRQTPESREKIRQALLGVRHSEERRRKNSLGHIGKPTPDTTGLVAWNRKPVGYVRYSNGHMQIKCPDGKFRYRARVMWEEANGPIPKGYLIHHVNHDPFDDRLENFQLVTRSEHMRGHATPERMRAAQKLAVSARKRNGTY